MEIINNYSYINNKLTNTTNDYILNYLQEYFLITYLTDFKINIVDNTINIINEYDLIYKYYKLFSLFDDIPNIYSGFININKLYLNVNDFNFKYIHPKNIYHVNLWEKIGMFLSENAINNFTTIYNYELSYLTNIFNNSKKIDNKYIINFKPIVDYIINNNNKFSYSQYDFIKNNNNELIFKKFFYSTNDILLDEKVNVNYYDLYKNYIKIVKNTIIIKRGYFFKIVKKVN